MKASADKSSAWNREKLTASSKSPEMTANSRFYRPNNPPGLRSYGIWVQNQVLKRYFVDGGLPRGQQRVLQGWFKQG